MIELQNAITNLITILHETRATLYAEANAAKDNLRAAQLTMEQSNAKLGEFVNLTAMLADASETLADDANVTHENINIILADMDIFALPVEKFEGYCDNCGCELSSDDEQFIDGDEVLCAKCDAELNPEVELAETVEE